MCSKASITAHLVPRSKAAGEICRERLGEGQPSPPAREKALQEAPLLLNQRGTSRFKDGALALTNLGVVPCFGKPFLGLVYQAGREGTLF